MKKRIYGYLGFGMTLGKIALIWLIVHLLGVSTVLASGVIVIMIITDALDGYIFRKSDWREYYGFGKARRWLDVVIDRVAIQICAWKMVEILEFPMVFYGLILGREALIYGIVVYGVITGRALEKPNHPSRIATIADGFTAIAWMLSGFIIAAASTLFMIIFGSIGLWKYFRTIQNKAPSSIKTFWDFRKIKTPIQP